MCRRLISSALVILALVSSADAASRAQRLLLSNNNKNLNSDNFSRYPNGAVMNSALPIIGPVWNTTGACTVTIASGRAICSAPGSGYLYANLPRPPQSIVAEVAFNGGTDLTAKGMTIAYSTDNPFTLLDLLHNNFGPLSFTLSVRQPAGTGGSFVPILTGNWRTPMSNDGVIHKVMLSFSGNTAMVAKDDSEFYYVTNPLVSVLAGPVVFWEPGIQADGLQAQVVKAYTLASSGFVFNQTSSYVGPGDVKASASMWWGLRAYSSATAGNRAANICNAADANCADISTLANGNFDVATAQGAPLNCGGTGGTCTLKILYDQSGANSCGGAACDFQQATIAARPVLTFSCLGALPCFTSSTATGAMQTGGSSSVAQPFTLVAMAQRTGNFTTYNTIITNTGGSVGLYYNTTGNADFFVGADHAFAASNSAWHALQAIGNSTTSSGTTDGSTTSISAASTAFTSAATIRAFNDSSPPGDAMLGTVTEFGVWPSAFAGGDLTAMNSNIHSYWGF